MARESDPLEIQGKGCLRVLISSAEGVLAKRGVAVGLVK